MKRENNSDMSAQLITTIRGLVDAFGGTGKFATFLHVVPSAVSNMIAQNDIPRGHHLDIYLECERRGFHIDKAKLFGITEEKSRRRSERAA